MAVPDFQVEHRLCLNGQAIPVETKAMILVGPLRLADTNSLTLPRFYSGEPGQLQGLWTYELAVQEPAVA